MGAKLQPGLLNAGFQVTGLESETIVINGRQWHEPLVLSSSLGPRAWLVDVKHPLEDSHFRALIDTEIDILLIGTGSRQVFIHPSVWSDTCRQAAVGVEFMTSAAACRTFNLLASENRRVVMATLLPGDAPPLWQPGTL